MIASAFLRFFTIKEDPVRSDVTRIIYNPIVRLACIPDGLRLNSALKDKSVISSIILKALSVTSCCFNTRCAVNSFSHSFPSFSAFVIFMDLSWPRNHSFFHNIWYNLMHHLIVWITDTMISNIPLTWIIIHCEPLTYRFRIFSIHSKTNTIPIFARLGVLFSPTLRSSLENSLTKAIHVSSFVKIFLWQSKGKSSFYAFSFYSSWIQYFLGLLNFISIVFIWKKHPVNHDAAFEDFYNQNLIFTNF